MNTLSCFSDMVTEHDLVEAAASQEVSRLTGGLMLSLGRNARVAQHVADFTGDAIMEPFRTVGLVDDEMNAFVAVLCRLRPDCDMVQLSVAPNFLPWSPAIVRTVVRIGFGEMGASDLLVASALDDAEKHALLHRLGFTPVAEGDARRVFCLSRDQLRPCLRRLVSCRLH